jgi:hypothetical protein
MSNRLGALVAVIGIAAAACVPAAQSPGTSAEATGQTSLAASTAPSIIDGTIEFGTGGTECSLTNRATTFPKSASFRLVANLKRPLHAGEANSMFVFGPAGTEEIKAPPPHRVAPCIYNDIYPGLAPGLYVIEMRAGSEVLAKGVFRITP